MYINFHYGKLSHNCNVVLKHIKARYIEHAGNFLIYSTVTHPYHFNVYIIILSVYA